MLEFDRAYDAHCQDIHNFLYSMLHSEQEARELTQDTFLAFLQEIRSKEMPLGKQRPWLFRVAKYKAYNTMRSHRRFTNAAQRVAKDNLLQERPTPESALSQEQDKDRVREVMKQMQERESTLLQLYSLELSYDEIAQVMSMERASIGKALARAKQSFRLLFQRDGDNRRRG